MNIRSPFRSRARPMPSIRWENTISGAFCAGRRVDRRAVYRVAARRIATIGPVEHAVVGSMSRSIGSGRLVVEEFDVSAVRRRLAFRKLDIRAEDATLRRRCRLPFASSRFVPAAGSTAMPTHHFSGVGGRHRPHSVSTRVSMFDPSRLARITRMPSRSHQ